MKLWAAQSQTLVVMLIITLSWASEQSAVQEWYPIKIDLLNNKMIKKWDFYSSWWFGIYSYLTFAIKKTRQTKHESKC